MTNPGEEPTDEQMGAVDTGIAPRSMPAVEYPAEEDARTDSNTNLFLRTFR